MKRINGAVILSLFLLFSFSSAFAEDNETSLYEVELNDSNLENELLIMDVPEGIALRFLQLEEQLEIKINHSNQIIEMIGEINSSIDTSDLQLIVDELVLIKDEVSNYTTIEAVNELEDALTTFVDLKTDSLELITEFRTIVNELLSDAEIELLHESLNLNYSNLGLETQIRNMIRMYNSERLQKMYQGINMQNDSVIGQVMNGTMNKEQIMIHLKSAYEDSNMTMQQFAVKLKQHVTEGKVNASAKIQQAVMNYTNRQIERIRVRIQNSNLTIGNASGLVQGLNNKIDSINEKVNAWMSSHTQDSGATSGSQTQGNNVDSGNQANGSGN